MSKQAVLSLAVPVERHQEVLSLEGGNNTEELCSEVEKLRGFRDSIFQLKKEVHHLSFMISEIRDVLETSSGARRFLI
ncbi:MAG: hypothetical protein OXM55_06475 [Bdellovibrionales bacterium]|nr:hypothetical protein [Bdellovibrionales bacterium]